MTPAEQIKAFVDCLYSPGDVVEVRRVNRTTGKADSTWHKAADLPELVAMFAACNAKAWDIYAGANPRPQQGAKGDACIELARCLFVDFDKTTLDAAMERIAGVLPDPTVIVESGHGVHCWWRFDEPFTDLGEWQRLQKDLIALLQSDPTIHNPERVMRLPGFTNHKQPAAPCTLFNADTQRIYEWADVLPCIPRKAEAPPPQTSPAPEPSVPPSPDDDGRRFRQCLASMLKIGVKDGNDGSKRLLTAACRCVEWNLSDADAVRCIHEYARLAPFPKNWTDAEILKRLRDAEAKETRGAADPSAIADDEPGKHRLTFGELQDNHPHLRPPIIEGLLRQGEIMTFIGAAKGCKSWLAHSIALSVATGGRWLGRFHTRQKRVLYLDNELHKETISFRSRTVAQELGIHRKDVETNIVYEALRGRLMDIEKVRVYLRKTVKPHEYGLLILDAAYRFIPQMFVENDNGDVARYFNVLEAIAFELGTAIVLVHHASKGVQGGKAVADVGAGAGAWSRCPDAHFVVRPHKEEDAAVFDAVNRNEPKMLPFCARWQFPIFIVDDTLDPADIRTETKRERKAAPAPAPAAPSEAKRTPEDFARQFVTDEPQEKALILARAFEMGIPDREANRLLLLANGKRLIFEWNYPKDRKPYFATRTQTPLESVQVNSHTHARAHSPITPEGGKTASGAGTKSERKRKRQTHPSHATHGESGESCAA